MWPSGKVRTMAAEKRSMIPRGLWRERGEQVRRGFFGFYNGRLITIHSSQPLEYETQRLGSTQWIWGENVSLNVASLVVRSVSHSGGMFLRLKGDCMCGGNVGTVWPFHATLLQTKNCSKTKPFTGQKHTSSTVVSCPSLWQNTWHKQLKGGEIYFGLWFQRFQSIVDWFHC